MFNFFANRSVHVGPIGRLEIFVEIFYWMVQIYFATTIYQKFI